MEESIGQVMSENFGKAPSEQASAQEAAAQIIQNGSELPLDQAESGNKEDALKEAVVEAKQEAEAKAKPETDQFASKFAHLARKERQIMQEKKKIEAQRKDYEALKAKVAELESIEKNLLSNPLAFLKAKGIEFEQLAQMELNDGKPSPDLMIKQMRQELEDNFKREVAALREQYENDKKVEAEGRYESTINEFQEEIKDFIGTNADRYELINAQNSHDAVYEVIKQHYEDSKKYNEDGTLLEDGTILSVEEAADLIEIELEKEARRLMQTKKLGIKTQSSDSAPASNAVAPKQTNGGTPSKTLSNSQSTKIPSSEGRLLSKEESLQRAASALKWI